VGALLLRQRLWGGGNLQQLIDAAPETGPEMITILSAIRHEVLKHNTMMLTGLTEALSRGEPATAEAGHIHRALLGPHGAAERLDGYVRQLEQLGRAHGLRLNLARRDAAISALLDGFAILDSVDVRLTRVQKLGRRGRQRLAERIREAATLLNEQGYDELQSVIEHVRTLVVDAEFLREVFEGIAAEPALASQRIAPLVLDPDSELPCVVSVPQQAFEEVLGNLLRNALQANLRAGKGPQVGLKVECDVDPITGLSDVLFLVRDRAGGELSAAELRGRTIEAGLGLTADRVSRYGGSLDVRPEQGEWTKAVVLRLPGDELMEPAE
jgi:signal transduction histidine kinase